VRDDGPAAPDAADRSLGSAMRRVVVTPTVAAGLGVVVAAVLAYPMQTVFSYVAPGAIGHGGLRCGQSGCGQPRQGNPAPFGLGGGQLNPAPPGSATPDNAGPAAPSGQAGGTAAAMPRLTYTIVSKWQGGFWGQITVTFPGAVPPEWKLRFGYPGGHILGMSPSSHLAPSGHAAVVRSTDYSGGTGTGGRTFAIGVGVQGVPAQPARCSFNGHACHIG
jgi:hypothetical protein